MLLMTMICSCLIFLNPDESISAAVHRQESRFEFEFGAMGSRFRVVGYADTIQRIETAKKRIEQRIQQLEQSLSDYRQDSEINQLASGAPHQHPVAISADLWRICTASAKIHRKTDGTFDPTIGPVSKIWRLARKRNRLPDQDDIDAVMKSVGWSKVMLNREQEFIQLMANGMQLDFGGIAKGYAADEAIGILEQLEVHSALVDAGGDIRVSQPPPGKAGWTVVIDNGFPSDNGFQSNNTEVSRIKLSIANVGVATSGDSAQRIIKNGHSHSHILDPRTGLAVQDSYGVTVIADDATTADGWASALSVLGPERGLEILKNELSVHALFIGRDPGDDYSRETWTPGMRKFKSEESVTNPAASVGN